MMNPVRGQRLYYNKHTVQSVSPNGKRITSYVPESVPTIDRVESLGFVVKILKYMSSSSHFLP